MDKLFETLGKILEKLLSSKTLWIIILVVAILSVAILAMTRDPAKVSELGKFFALEMFVPCEPAGWKCPRTWVGLAALVSIALILAKVVIWIIGRIRERYFV
jgi:hypothetical protein